MDIFYTILQYTIAVAIPLAVVALGALFSEKSGIINIALEGIMLVGAFVGAIVITQLETHTFKDIEVVDSSTIVVEFVYDITINETDLEEVDGEILYNGENFSIQSERDLGENVSQQNIEIKKVIYEEVDGDQLFTIIIQNGSQINTSSNMSYNLSFTNSVNSQSIDNYVFVGGDSNNSTGYIVVLILFILIIIATIISIIFYKKYIDLIIVSSVSGVLILIISLLIMSSITFSLQVIILIALLAGGIAGMLFSVLHAYACVNMNANQVISGIALNMLAIAGTVFLARSINDNNVRDIRISNTYLIKEVPFLSDIPIIGDIFFKQTYFSTFIVIAIFFIAYFVLYKTRFGLRLKACGENPQAADSAGINVYKMRYAGVLVSGFLAGIGGVIFIVSFSNAYVGSVYGFGFLALAVLIFGAWDLRKILVAALFFGFMRVISTQYSLIPILSDINFATSDRVTNVTQEVYSIIPYVATLVILAFVSVNSKAPKAVGEPYDQGKR